MCPHRSAACSRETCLHSSLGAQTWFPNRSLLLCAQAEEKREREEEERKKEEHK